MSTMRFVDDVVILQGHNRTVAPQIIAGKHADYISLIDSAFDIMRANDVLRATVLVWDADISEYRLSEWLEAL